ncbi:MAG: beta strand repeat-containing protein, partial [Methylococcaceae bacterium]
LVGTQAAYGSINTTVGFVRMTKLVDATMKGPDNLLVAYKAAATVGTADAQNLTVDGVGKAATAVGFSNFETNGGIETLNITTANSSSYLRLTDENGDGNNTGTVAAMAGLQKVTVAGSADLTLDLTNASGTGVITVDASTFSGALTLEGINTAGVTLTGGNGNDTFDFTYSSSGVAGTGSHFDAGTGTVHDSLAGGGGVDTLMIGSGATFSDDQFKNVSSIEVLYLSGSGASGSGDLGANAAAAGITTVRDGTGSGDIINLTVGTGFNKALTVELHGTGDTVNASGSAGDITVKYLVTGSGATGIYNEGIFGSTGTGTVDTLELSAAGTGSPMNMSGITNFEKIKINADGSNSIVLSMDDGNVASGKTLIIDATNLTNSSASLTLSGAAEADGKFSVLGGAGNDIIYLGSGNDTVDGGAGKDTIYGTGGGNDSIMGGDGNDTIDMGGALTTGDTIDGGSGTDTLVLSGSTISNSMFTSVSNVEILSLASGVTVTLTGNINQFTSFDLTTSGATTLNFGSGYTSATTVEMGSGDVVTNSSTANITANITEANASGTLNYTGGTGGIDTVNITVGTGESVTLGTSSKIDVINILDSTGTGDHDMLLVATGYTSALKVDASQLDAGTSTGSGPLYLDETLTFSGANATGSFTVLGGAGQDTIIGGSGADSIDGGAGNDTLVLGVGNDWVQGGDGDDRIIFGSGTGSANDGYLTNDDTVIGGSGTDTLVIQSTGTAGFGDVNFLNTTGMEVLELSSGSGTVTLGYFAENKAGITKVVLGDATSAYTVLADAYSSSLTYDLNANTGDVSLKGGLGSDVFVVHGSGILNASDTLVGGNGTDTLRLDNTNGSNSSGQAVVATVSSGISGIEKIDVLDNATGTAGTVNLTIDSGYSTTGTLLIDASTLDSGETFTLTATGLGSTQA